MLSKHTHIVTRFLTAALVTLVVACSGFFSSVALAMTVNQLTAPDLIRHKAEILVLINTYENDYEPSDWLYANFYIAKELGISNLKMDGTPDQNNPDTGTGAYEKDSTSRQFGRKIQELIGAKTIGPYGLDGKIGKETMKVLRVFLEKNSAGSTSGASSGGSDLTATRDKLVEVKIAAGRFNVSGVGTIGTAGVSGGAAARTSGSFPLGSNLRQPQQNCNLLSSTPSASDSSFLGKVLSNVSINTPVGSVTIDGCDSSNGPALDGPGAYDGLQAFKSNYKGSHYGSAMGILAGWTNFALPFVSIISIVALVYAGFLYITAMGNDEQTGKAKKIILWVVVGIVVIYSAYAIVNTVISGTSG